MSWLIGIVAVVIVVYFWRIFLPLGVVAGLVLGAVLLYADYQSGQKKAEKAAADAALRERIAAAQSTASAEGKSWHVRTEPDPASGREIVRAAWIQSNDGLCTLTVEKRINGAELTDLRCPGIVISQFDDISVKFNNQDTARPMRLDSYSNSDDVYIPKSQYGHSGQLSYQDFITGLTTAEAVAIELPAAGGFWARFNLDSSAEVIQSLGKEFPAQSRSGN